MMLKASCSPSHFVAFIGRLVPWAPGCVLRVFPASVAFPEGRCGLRTRERTLSRLCCGSDPHLLSRTNSKHSRTSDTLERSRFKSILLEFATAFTTSAAPCAQPTQNMSRSWQSQRTQHGAAKDGGAPRCARFPSFESCRTRVALWFTLYFDSW